MNECKVSLIIPVYNAERYLRRCLDSAIGQTLKDIEIIVVNDGSTDHSLSIINEYKELINASRLLHKGTVESERQEILD